MFLISYRFWAKALLLAVFPLLILSIPSRGLTADEFGYKVVVKLLRSKKEMIPSAKSLILTVIPIPPSHDGTLTYEFEGIDLSPLGDKINDQNARKQLALSYINKVQLAYDTICEKKGLFKIGDAFHKSLYQLEPFYDGRSAFTAIYEGWNYSEPRATFGVSYSTIKNPRLPIVIRANTTMEKFGIPFTPLTPINDVSEAPLDIGLDLGQFIYSALLRLSQHLHPEVFENFAKWKTSFFEFLDLKSMSQEIFKSQSQAEQKESFARAAQAKLQNFSETLSSLSQPIQLLGLAHLFMNDPEILNAPGAKITQTKDVTSSQGEALKEFLHSKLSHERIFMGGYPLQIRSLTHMVGSLKEDYMLSLFLNSSNMGFFDIVPARLGLPIPLSLVGETSPRHLETAYKDWHFDRMGTFFDPAFNGEVAKVSLTRQGFSELLKLFFVRELSTEQNKHEGPVKIVDDFLKSAKSDKEIEEIFSGRAMMLAMEPQNSKVRASWPLESVRSNIAESCIADLNFSSDKKP